MFRVDTVEEEVGLDISHHKGAAYDLSGPTEAAVEKFEISTSQRKLEVPKDDPKGDEEDAAEVNKGNLGPVLFSTSCLSFAVTSVSFLYSFVIIVISDHNFSQREGCILHLLVILTTQCHHGITGENISFTNILRHKRTVLRMC